jgi:hypothetical protein
MLQPSANTLVQQPTALVYAEMCMVHETATKKSISRCGTSYVESCADRSYSRSKPVRTL